MSLNLLPKSQIENQKKMSFIYLVNKVSIGLLIILVILTAGTLIMRIFQKLEFERSAEIVKLAEAKVNSLQTKESSLLLLKHKLDQVSQLSEVDAKRKAIFSLIIFLSPADLSFTDINIGRDGSAVITAASGSLISIDQLMSNLGSKEKNAGVINKVVLDGLSLGKDSIYRFSIKVYPK